MNQAETVERMKREIIADVVAGKVSPDVKTFGDLHDFVDANCYGGFCEDEFDPERDENGDMTQAQVDFFNACQTEVHEWIVAKGLEARAMFRCGDLEYLGADEVLSLVYELRAQCWDWANRYQTLRTELTRHMLSRTNTTKENDMKK